MSSPYPSARNEAPHGPAANLRGDPGPPARTLAVAASGVARRATASSIEAYTVNCGRCQRPCAHGPYFGWYSAVTSGSMPTDLRAAGGGQRRRRGGAPATADHGRKQARDRHALGAFLANSALRAVAMGPGEGWWPTSRLARMRAAARDQGKHERGRGWCHVRRMATSPDDAADHCATAPAPRRSGAPVAVDRRHRRHRARRSYETPARPATNAWRRHRAPLRADHGSPTA